MIWWFQLSYALMWTYSFPLIRTVFIACWNSLISGVRKTVHTSISAPPLLFICVLCCIWMYFFVVLWQMRNSNNLEHSELREIAGSGSISAPACFATAGTTLIIGFVPSVNSKNKDYHLIFLKYKSYLYSYSWFYLLLVFL